MGTKFGELFDRLAAPFPEGQIRYKTTGGRSMPYIQAHTVMERLDEVIGPENWWSELYPSGTTAGTSWLCKLSIRLPDGSVVTKSDVGANAGMTVRNRDGSESIDSENDDKSGASDALKRAAVHFGIARYLRSGGTGSASAPQHSGQRSGSWGPSSHAPATQQRPPAREPGSDDDRDDRPRGGTGQPPRTGRALFAWVKDQENRGASGLLQWVNQFGKTRGYAGRIVDWQPSEVEEAHAEAVRAMSASVPAGAEMDEPPY